MTDLKSFLPQGMAISSLIEEINENHMTHALLISGEEGIGKWTLGTAIASALLCRGAAERPCGRCASCLQMEAMSHPDLIVIQKGHPISSKPANMSAIPIEDIREMIVKTGMHAFEGNRKVVMIRHAEDMNIYAQNAFLKTLEEPPEGTFFILTAVKTDALLPTIISRCRPVKLHPWSNDQVFKFLIDAGIEKEKAHQAVPAANGSIGEALKIAADENYWSFRREVMQDFLEIHRRSDILIISNRWKDRKKDSELLFSLLENFFSQLMRCSFLLEDRAAIKEFPDQWISFAEKATAKDYDNLSEGLILARKRTEANVNFQAVTEQLILTMMEAIGR